ncbi:hypothetical protein ACVWYV_002921 [Pantoea eucalypti]
MFTNVISVKCNARNEKDKPQIGNAGNAKAIALLMIAASNDRRYSLKAYSQGGAQFPTGGKSASAESPRALYLDEKRDKGQQIRCNSGADGYSPDGRG